MIEVLSSMAEQERLTIRRRQREGIDAAKNKGKHLGQPRLVMPECFPFVYQEWRNGTITAKEAMKKTGLSSTSFYRMVNMYEGVPKGV